MLPMQKSRLGIFPRIALYSLSLLIFSFHSEWSFACDNTATQSAGNIQYIGDGLYTIDIENCIGDGGSEDGFTIDISDVNIVGFYPATLINGTYIATGSFDNGDVTYSYNGTDFFVAPNQNTCFEYTLTLDGFPATATVTLSGVNTPGGCAILDGDTQATPVIPTPACGSMFTDTGGANNPYGNNEDYGVTICGGNAPLTVDFSQFELALDGDVMTVFDNNIAAGSFTTHTGGNSPGTVTSTNSSNCLTFIFESNSFGEESLGWIAEVICTNPCPNDLAVAASPSSLTCANSTDGTIDLATSGGALPYSFAWSSGQTIDNLEDLTLGTYEVTVTDGNGCTATTSAIMAVANPIIIDITSTAVNCSTPDGTFSATVTGGGSPPFSYSWSNGSSSPVQSGLPVGIYDLTVTDFDNCESTASVTLVYDTDLLPVATPSQAASCFNSPDGAASVVASGGMGTYTFEWDNGETGTNASQLTTGEHTVSVTDLEGCTITTTVTIDGPDEIIAQTDTAPASCFGSNDGSAWIVPQGGIPPYTFLWDNGQLTDTSYNMPAGIHALTITDFINCSSVINVEVLQPEAPLNTILSTIEPICGGNSDGLIATEVSGGTAGYTFQWSNGDSLAVANNLIAGNYTVTTTDANGCIEIQSIALTEPPLIAYDFSQSALDCYGDDTGSVTISNVSGGGGIGLYTYSLDGITYESSPTFIRLEAGDYTFYIQDDEGCIATQNFAITEPPELLLDAGEDIDLEYGDSIILNPSISIPGNYTYEWTSASPEGTMSCTDCLNPLVQPLYDIVYTLNIINENGCEASDEIRVNVVETQRIFIPTAFTPNGDNANDFFMIHGGKGATIITLFNVYDRWGGLVYSITDAPLNSPDAGWDGTHRGQELSSGVYTYYATILFDDGEELPYKGSVTLIR